MAREVAIHVWCDRHMIKGDRVAGSSHDIRLDGGPERQLDLCDDCWAEIAEPLAQLLEETAQPAKPASAPMQCPVCGQQLANRPGVAGHVQSIHGRSLQEIEGQLGVLVDGRPVVEWCVTCGAGWANGHGQRQHETATGHTETTRVRPESAAA